MGTIVPYEGTGGRGQHLVGKEAGIKRNVGGPGRVRTDDLFHAMEARSQLRHRPTCRKRKLLRPAWTVSILAHLLGIVKPSPASCTYCASRLCETEENEYPVDGQATKS